MCVLTALQAEKLEQRGELPNCEFHQHIRVREALDLVGDNDGMGGARLVQHSDSRMRITRLPRIVRWHGVPCFYDAMGAMGPTVMQPLYEPTR